MPFEPHKHFLRYSAWQSDRHWMYFECEMCGEPYWVMRNSYVFVVAGGCGLLNGRQVEILSRV